LSPRWRLIYACEKGTSHEAAGTPCQDSVYGDVVDFDGVPALLIAVSDGAGSASHGEEGSETACLVLQQAARAWIDGTGPAFPPSDAILRGWVQTVHQCLVEKAAAADLRPRDFACTLLAAICTPGWSACLQIGDGALVARDSKGLRVIFWPESGEYANQTYFVTDPGYEQHVLTSSDVGPITDLAAMTDGLQRLALNFADRSPHAAFFEPLFSTLRKQPFELVEELDGAVVQLLRGPAVNSRTDDDKTLLIASFDQGG